MKRKVLSLILCLTLLLTMTPGMTIAAWADTKEETSIVTPVVTDKESDKTGSDGQGTIISDVSSDTKTTGEPILAYVPLDNRPVNIDRVIYEAESAGFKVMMPDADLYTTRLDGQPLNSNGTQFGDGKKILNWILETDKVADYFVISLDQLLSGGLVNSRTLHNTDFSEEYGMIDAIINLARNNHVYIIDTVARLATCTVGYQEATLETYNYLRQYNLQSRALLTDENLTVANIAEGYSKDEENREILVDPGYANQVKNSLQTRVRKMSLIDYILTADDSGRIKYFIGIDDSNAKTTIQTNEIDFIKKKMGSRGLIYSGADELGMMAVLSLMIDYYGHKVDTGVVYFGSTEKSSSGSIYDMETVRENLEKHLDSIGVNVVDTEEADLEIVVLTLPAQSIMNVKYINRMIDYINKNIAEGIPTIVINSAPSAYSGNFEYRMIRECEMSMLLSYSSWGTVGNAIGLALGNGISRYLYLQSRDNSSDRADIAFLKGLIFSYEKDISYLRGGGKELFNNYLGLKNWSASNFYQNDEQVKKVNNDIEVIFKTSDYNVTVNDIIDNLTDCRYFKGLGGECGIIGSIRLSNYSAPFMRSYEIRFDIDVDLSEITINGFKDTVMISMPYTPPEGQRTYAVTLYFRDETGKLHKVPSTYDKATGRITFTTGSLSSFFLDTLSMDAEKAHGLFTDVSESAWYFDDVLYVYEKGIFSGTSSNTFEPETPMTRGMLMSVLHRIAGTPKSDYWYEMPHDVSKSWYEPGVKWALANKIVSGYVNGSFGPNDPITREQLASVLWRYAKYKNMDVSKGKYPGANTYPDVSDLSEGFLEGVDWACTTGILTGSGIDSKQLLPKASATRAEVAAVLKRFLEK
ncbi:DUF4127 family protein [Dehalobacterium formicoaceticum]|uniref:DUF4127 family protein n=1 Tax=Dehalobacterium formicoaceticum TaxID=51515 RepID=UPI0018DF0516|nr:DUF4127 family protein [Dehalobacterium formicoaceticum]